MGVYVGVCGCVRNIYVFNHRLHHEDYSVWLHLIMMQPLENTSALSVCIELS